MNTPLSNEIAGKIRGYVRAGRKIDAIRLYREHTGLGLKESKDAIEEMDAAMRGEGGADNAPGTGAGSANRSYRVAKGCASVLAVAVIVVAAGAFVLTR